MKPRIAIVSPFLDKRHGTERCVAEQIDRLTADYEIVLYSQAVCDVDLARITWRRIPRLPGPHLFAYGWWVLANHAWRWWDARFRGLRPALVYSPGINCYDADVISVHVVFAEFYRRAGHTLGFGANPLRAWPRLAHRRLYYRLIMALERVVYGGRKVTLTAVSTKVARELAQHYGWTLEWGREAAAFNAMGISHPLSGRVQLTEGMAAASRPQSEGGGVVPPIPVIFHGIDPGRFNPETRARRRAGARATLGMGEDEFCLLLVGNDWKNKGLPTLLGSLDRLREPRVRLLVVGQDTVEPYRKMIDRLGLGRRVTFRSPRPDVEFYYAAADLYAGPSLEDAFGLPPLEAMACGLPVITSAQAGVSEVITEGVDGFVIDNPQDSAKLSDLIALLYQNQDLRKRVGEAAALTAKQYSWDRNARELGQVFQEVLRRRNSLVNGMQGTLGGAPDTRAEARVGQNVQ